MTSLEPTVPEIRHKPPSAAPAETAPTLQRVRGEVRIGVTARQGVSRLETLHQSGSARVRLPRRRLDAPFEAVLLNTAGGLTGGDRLSHRVAVGPGAAAIIATQAAERIYRSASGVADIATEIAVAAGARLDWLPQETILFDRSALSRRFCADVDPGGVLLAVEAFILGRTAMGETVHDVFLSDAWRIRRGGRLVFADTTRLDGDANAIIGHRATADGAVAAATLVLISPDAEARIDAARAALADGRGEGGVSAWNGMLVARLIGRSGQALRVDLTKLVETLCRRAMPRVWRC